MKFDMNVDMVKNLTKLCCICFGEGEFDVREYSVKLGMDDEISIIPGEETSSDRRSQGTLEEEFSALHMLEIFKKKKEPDLYQDHDLSSLICQVCVDELVSSFLFYRKVQKAYDKLSEILSSDIKMETDLNNDEAIGTDLNNDEAIGVEYLIEDLEDEEDSPEANVQFKESKDEVQYKESQFKESKDEVQFKESKEELKHNKKSPFDCSEKQELAEEFAENDTKTKDNGPKHGIKRKVVKQRPTIVLTGGVSQMLSHISSGAKQKTAIPPTRKCIPVPSTKPSPQKRLKTQREKYQPLEEGSFVVAQFIPSSTQIHMETLYPSEDHQGHQEFPLSCNEIRTMDFAAVEIASSSELKINEADTNTSNNKVNNNIATGNSCSSGEHSSQPVYVCKYCPQAFSASHFLITHVRKSHVCKFCTLAFTKSTDLFEHIRSEHNEHKCAICRKELSTHSNLRSHIKRVHGVKLPAQVALLDYRRRSGTATDVPNEEIQRDDVTNSNTIKINDVEEQEVCIDFENDDMEFIKHSDDLENEQQLL